MHELNETEATLLAQMLHQIRPDWTTNSLLSILWENRNTPSYPALIIAAVTKAQDPGCRTPAPIFLDGQHWPQSSRAHIPAGKPCADHPTQQAHSCTSCQADIKLGQRPPHMQGQRMSNGRPNPAGAKQLREALRRMHSDAPDNPTPTGSNHETPPSDM